MEDRDKIQELLVDMNTIMCKKHQTTTELPQSMSVAVKRMIESAHHNASAATRYLIYCFFIYLAIKSLTDRSDIDLSDC